jgi:hypothetical protein
MKIIQPVNIQVVSRRVLLRPAKFLEFMQFFENALPQLKPSVFNWTDPVNKPWDLGNFENYLPPDRLGDADNIYWRKRSQPKADGYFHVGQHANSSFGLRYSGVSLIAEMRSLDIHAALDYIKRASVKFDGVIAQVHWMAPKETSIRDSECSFDMAGANGGSEFVTSSLIHWLPALPWAIVFGDAYVKMFGMERLMSAPAYIVERLSDSAVYMQLSPSLTDLKSDYDAFHAERQRVQEHLGNEAFFDPARAYPLRGPMGEIPADQFLKALADFHCPPPGTNGFRVPEFRFIPD